MFVDVSNMTAREIQRLGHEDDEGPVQRQWTSHRSAGSGHSGYRVTCGVRHAMHNASMVSTSNKMSGNCPQSQPLLCNSNAKAIATS